MIDKLLTLLKGEMVLSRKENADAFNQQQAQINSLTESVASLASAISNQPAPQIDVQVPDIIVPDPAPIEIPPIIIPEIKIPDIIIPEIKIPEIKMPEVKVDMTGIESAIASLKDSFQTQTPEGNVRMGDELRSALSGMLSTPLKVDWSGMPSPTLPPISIPPIAFPAQRDAYFSINKDGEHINPATEDTLLEIKALLNIYVDNEVPAGVLNGVNTSFTTTYSYKTGSTKLYVNGVRQREGLGFDYLEAGGNNLTLIVPPILTDSLIVDYKKL